MKGSYIPAVTSKGTDHCVPGLFPKRDDIVKTGRMLRVSWHKVEGSCAVHDEPHVTFGIYSRTATTRFPFSPVVGLSHQYKRVVIKQFLI